MAAAVRRGLLACTAVAALLAVGCGGGSHDQTQAAETAAPAATATVTPAQTTAPHPAAHKGGGGSSSPSTTAAAPAATPSPAPHPRRRFVYIAATICTGGGGAAHLGPPPASPSGLQAYATQALRGAQTISVLLERLSQQTGQDDAVSKLLADYRALVALYRQTAQAGAPPGAVELIRRAQRRTAAAAMALHLPACVPA